MNYGAEMQAYATVRALTELGHDVSIIDLRLEDINILSVKGRIAKVIEPFSLDYRHFHNFWSRYFPKTIRYKSVEALRKNPPQADMYLVGSDQTWNPNIMKSLFPVSLLEFGDDNVIRASYASSFGVNYWDFPATLTEVMSSALKKFKFISCREKTGCDILQQMFGVKLVSNVLDPTLLHQDYTEITGELKESKTLAYYPLSSTDNETGKYAKSLASLLNLDPINVNCIEYIGNKIIWNRTPIEEWIFSIGSAQFVLTKSFHGLAFSLIHKRQFAIVNNKNVSSRISDLLALLGLQGRLFKTYDEMMESKIWEDKIDYNIITPKLEALRKQSWDYLMNLKS